MFGNVELLAHFDKPIEKAQQGLRRYGYGKNTQQNGGFPLYYKPFESKPEHQTRSISLPNASSVHSKQVEDIQFLRQMLYEKEEELARIRATKKNPPAFEPVNEYQPDSYQPTGPENSTNAYSHEPNQPPEYLHYPSDSPMRTDDSYQLQAETAARPEPKTFYPYQTPYMPAPQAVPIQNSSPSLVQQENGYEAHSYQPHRQAAPVENASYLPPQQESQNYEPPAAETKVPSPHFISTTGDSQYPWNPQPQAECDVQNQNTLAYQSSFHSPQRHVDAAPTQENQLYEQPGPSPQQYTFLTTQPDQYATQQPMHRSPTPYVPPVQQPYPGPQAAMPSNAINLRPIAESQAPRQQQTGYDYNPQSPVKLDPPNVFRRAYDPSIRESGPPMRYKTPDPMRNQKKSIFQTNQTTNDYTMPLQKYQTFQTSSSYSPSPIPTNHLYMYGPNAQSNPNADVRYAKKQPKNIAYNPMLGSVQDTTTYNMSSEPHVDPYKAYGVPLPRQTTQMNNKGYKLSNQKYYSPPTNKDWQYQSGPNIFQAPRENNQHQLHASQSQYGGIGVSKYGNLRH